MKLNNKSASPRKKSKVPGLIAAVLILAVVGAAGFFFYPELVHRCDDCGKLFVGSGYYGNIVTETFASITGRDEKILCADCASDEHAVSIAIGKSIDEFKRPFTYPWDK